MDAGFHASGCAGPIGGKGLTIPPDRRLMHGNELWKTATLLYRAENLTGMPFFLTKKILRDEPEDLYISDLSRSPDP